MAFKSMTKFPKRCLRAFKQRYAMTNIRAACPAVSDWFRTPLGATVLKAETAAVNEQLSYLFGYHLMQLSTVAHADFSGSSRINHCFSLAPFDCGQIKVDVESEGEFYVGKSPEAQSEFDALPLPDECIDVTILHHVLEFSDNPQQVLKEASRVTMPRGYIIILGFNPVSLPGLMQPFGAFMRKNVVAKRRHLRVGRMRDWLAFLDFTCVDTEYLFHDLPVNSAKYLNSSRLVRQFCHTKKIPFGLSYCILARKDKAGLTPIKPKWAERRLLGAMPIPKQALGGQATSAASVETDKLAAVLPFRTSFKQEK